MIGEIGPRLITWRDSDGNSGVITIIVRGLSDHAVDLGEGDILMRKKAEVVISASWLQRTMHAIGSDDLQVLFQLIRFSNIYIKQMCADYHILVDEFTTGELCTDFGLFR